MRFRTLFLASIVTISLVTSTQAGYIGYQLSRGPVENFVLTDQDDQSYDFNNDSNEIIILTFIFTRCPDVCPTITQSMKSVEQLLSPEEREHVTFLSITTDPQYDTPEQLSTFARMNQVNWTHLTGSEQELFPVWSTFGIAVNNQYTDDAEKEFEQDLRSQSILIVNQSGNSSQHMLAFDGWTWTQIFAAQHNILFNASESQYGHYVTSINEKEANETWWWELLIWSQKYQTWIQSEVGIDELDVLDTPHFAWKPSDLNASLVQAPTMTDAASMTVQLTDNVSQYSSLKSWNGFASTSSSLMSHGTDVNISQSSFGNYLVSIEGQPTSEQSWWWRLTAWNETNNAWEETQVGMDEVNATTTLAWSPSTLNLSEIPAPLQSGDNSEVCSGHGWLMGENETLHCMCDEGYSWADNSNLLCIEDRTKNYTVGHSAATYILDGSRTPRVMWTGEQWRAEDFVEDVRTLMEKEHTQGVPEAPGLPGFTFPLVALGGLLAFLMADVVGISTRESRKK